MTQLDGSLRIADILRGGTCLIRPVRWVLSYRFLFSLLTSSVIGYKRRAIRGVRLTSFAPRKTYTSR